MHPIHPFKSAKPVPQALHERIRQVFWLPDRPQRRAFPRFPAVAALWRATFVPGYSGGPAADLHGIP
jgi:hypothetical protein